MHQRCAKSTIASTTFMQEASGVFGPEQGIDMGGDETNKRTVTDADPNKRNAEWGDLW